MAANPKNKAVALILAIFLGFWTWLYTYQKEAWKFWLSLFLTLAGMIALAITTVNILISRETRADLVSAWLVGWVIAYTITIGLWVWGIVDRAVKKDAWFEDYPKQ